MSPAETKEWLDLILGYGPWGLLAVFMIILGFLWQKGILNFGRTANLAPIQQPIESEKRSRKEDTSGSQRRIERQWVTNSCPLAPDFSRIERKFDELVIETRGLRDEQIRGNGWLELLAEMSIFDVKYAGEQDIKEKHAKATQQKILERMRESQRESERIEREDSGEKFE